MDACLEKGMNPSMNLNWIANSIFYENDHYTHRKMRECCVKRNNSYLFIWKKNTVFIYEKKIVL